jgi:hypothetical protein
VSAPHVSAPPPDARFVCERFALGEPAGEMTPVAGGLSNRMWRLVTDRGAFAIKQLELANANPVWPPWIERAFRFECSAFEHGVPMPRPISVAATGGCLAEIADDAGVVTSLRAHAWVEGRPLASVVHGAATSERVGAMLAGVHAVHSVVEDFDGGDALHVLGESHWLERAERVERARADWAWEFRELLPVIDALEAYIIEARGDPATTILGHRDACQGNFLETAAGDLVLIDWDFAGPVHPRHEVAKEALGWAGVDLGAPDARAAHGLVEGYRRAGGAFDHVQRTDFGEFMAIALDWFDLNVRRTLGEWLRDEGDRALGEGIVRASFKNLPRFARSIDRWVQILE